MRSTKKHTMPFVRMQTLCPGIKYMDRPKAEKVLICEKGQAHVKTKTPSFLSETTPEHLVRIVFTIIFPLVFSFVFALVFTLVFARWWLGRGLLRLIFVVCLRVCHMRVWRKNLSSDLTPPHPLPTRNSSRAMVKSDALHYLPRRNKSLPARCSQSLANVGNELQWRNHAEVKTSSPNKIRKTEGKDQTKKQGLLTRHYKSENSRVLTARKSN